MKDDRSIAPRVSTAPPIRLLIAPPVRLSIGSHTKSNKICTEFDYLRIAADRASNVKRENPRSLPRHRKMVTAPRPPNNILDGVSQKRMVIIENSTPPRFSLTLSTTPPIEQ